MKKDFVHLHLHTEFSLLDGANRIKELPKRIKELGMHSVAITDHGVMYGVIDFYKECVKEGIKPIIGVEAYVAEGSRKDRDPVKDKKRYHLVLLVKNEIGYQNLTHMVSLSNTEGMYYKPRIDKELLEKHCEGLIALSACAAGEVSSTLMKEENGYEKAKEIALWYKSIFKDDYYIEIQSNGVDEQVILNAQLIKLAKELNIPLVATNDSHYMYKEDAETHEILLAMQTGKKMSDPTRMKFGTNELYIKSIDEMYEAFGNIPEALENTVKIAEKCNFTIEFGNTKLPNYEIKGRDHAEYLKELCFVGLKKRYQNITKEIQDRLEYELDVITKMGFVDYFLIVWDFIRYAKEQNIPVGPGRGSGAGSLAAYALEITDIDPLKYNLLFERFLNPERISMPDFDIDFCNERREEVIKYVENKYGKDHVAQIITFGTLAAKAVIRDIGRVLEVPLDKINKVSKNIPSRPNITIDGALEVSKEFKEMYDTDVEVKKVVDIARKFEGMPKNVSTHACGLVITDKPVEKYVPLAVNDENIVTQYTMNLLEEIGLLKMDFLGLRTLTVIAECKKIVEKTKGLKAEVDKEMSDPKVFELWQTGNTLGVFQFESVGMIRFMKELKPDTLEDIIAGVALYRPGPMDQIPRYIQGKRGGKIEYTHESLKPILEVTYGCMVYQEQVMEIARKLAGYSLGRADLLRRAMGKKKMDIMKKERQAFIYGEKDNDGNVIVKGCIANGISEKSGNAIFDEMVEFAKYAFNKSHAAAYAVLAYQTAYLKKYYPSEMLAATMNSYIGNLDKIPIYIEEASRLGIKVLQPHVNKSFVKFGVEKETGNIVFGLGSIKNMGIIAAEKIVEERKLNGKFKDFEDFIVRMKNQGVNKRTIETLIKVGALDDLGKNRGTLLASYETVIDYLWGNRNVMAGQVSMFDISGEDVEPDIYMEVNDLKKHEKLAYEKEILGIYLSGHPLQKLNKYLEKMTSINSRNKAEIINNETNKYIDKQKVKYAGIIEKIEKRYSKKGNLMVFLDVSDVYGTFRILFFEPVYRMCIDSIKENKLVGIVGRLNIQDEEVIIMAENIKEIKINGKSLNGDNN